MARSVALVAFGIVVGVLGGAALQIHAANEGGMGEGADQTGEANEGGTESGIAPEVEAVTSPAPQPPVSRDLTAESPLTQQTPEPPPGIWDRMAQCEASGDWHNAKNPRYKGGLQMDADFWRNYGGLAYAPAPHLASRAQQITVAIRGQAVQGWSAWPVCSRVIGVR